MKNTKIIFILTVLLICSFTVFTNAQTKRRKTAVNRKPVVRGQQPVRPAPTLPQPAAVNPKVLEPEVVSTAQDEALADEAQNQESTDSVDSSEKQIPAGDKTSINANGLSQQIEKLNNKINSLEGDQRSLVNLEKLTRAEERAELLRKQLENAVEKETALNSRLEQLDYQSRPEIIEREMAGVGSTRPEEIRETRRKMLENEKLRAKQQLGQVKENRTRLETAVTNAESLVEKLSAIVENENKVRKSIGNPQNGASNVSNNESQPQ